MPILDLQSTLYVFFSCFTEQSVSHIQSEDYHVEHPSEASVKVSSRSNQLVLTVLEKILSYGWWWGVVIFKGCGYIKSACGYIVA